MARVLNVVFVGLVGLSLCRAEDVYKVNDFLDGSLKELAQKIAASGDITVRLDKITLGNYTLTGARLADITTLRRQGDAWMWNDFQTVVVNGSLTLQSMFLAEAKVTGPVDIKDPLFTVRQNSLAFTVRILLDTKASCSANYDLQWTSLEGVRLYSANPSMSNLDVSRWAKTYLAALNAAFVTPILRLFEHHVHMCESRWLNELEMIKYKLEAEEMQRLNMSL